MKQYLLTTTSVLFLAGSLAAAGFVTGTPATAQTTQMDEPEGVEEMQTDDDGPEMETDDDSRQMGQQRQKRRDRMMQGRYQRDGDRYHQSRMRYHGDRDRMMGGMMGHGMGHGHMMRMMFIIADADGNDALSLQEIQTIHERIFNAVDEDDDGEVTMEEMQSFMSDMQGGSKKKGSKRQ